MSQNPRLALTRGRYHQGSFIIIASVLGLSLVGCGTSNTSGSAPATVNASASSGVGSSSNPSQPAERQTLVVAGFGGSFEDAQREIVIAEFEKRYNATVQLETAPSSEVMAKLQAQGAGSGYDVVQFSGGQETLAYQLGLIADLDPSIVTNAANVYEEATRNAGKTAPAYAFNTTGLIYRTDAFDPAPTSWEALFDPAHKGRVAIDDIVQTAGVNLLLSLAKINGGDENNVEPGFEALERLLPNLHSIYDDATTMTQLMAQNQIDLAVFDSGYGYLLQQQGLPVRFAVPDGAVLYGLTASPVAGSDQLELAQAFINVMLDPAVQVAFAERAGYAPTNRSAQLSTELAQQMPLLDALDRTWSYDPQVVNENRADWTQRWNEITANQ